MTGEVSLLGQVLPVGGIREKILAAIRSGIPEIILPGRNAEEILRLGQDVRRRIKVHLIDDVGEAFKLALVNSPQAKAQGVRSFRRREAKRAHRRRSKDGEST